MSYTPQEMEQLGDDYAMRRSPAERAKFARISTFGANRHLLTAMSEDDVMYPLYDWAVEAFRRGLKAASRRKNNPSAAYTAHAKKNGRKVATLHFTHDNLPAAKKDAAALAGMIPGAKGLVEVKRNPSKARSMRPKLIGKVFYHTGFGGADTLDDISIFYKVVAVPDTATGDPDKVNVSVRQLSNVLAPKPPGQHKQYITFEGSGDAPQYITYLGMKQAAYVAPGDVTRYYYPEDASYSKKRGTISLGRHTLRPYDPDKIYLSLDPGDLEKAKAEAKRQKEADFNRRYPVVQSSSAPGLNKDKAEEMMRSFARMMGAQRNPANPPRETVLGHVVIHSKAGYTIPAYKRTFSAMKDVRKWLKEHVKRETSATPNPRCRCKK